LMYASQNFAGNLIANQATFFFERMYLPLTHPKQLPLTPNTTNTKYRGWNLPRPRFPIKSNQLLSPIRRQWNLLGLHRLVRPPNNLPLGHSNKHNPPDHPRNLRLHRPNNRNKLRPSRSGDHNLLRLRRNPRPNLIHHHLRDIIRASARTQYWCRSCGVLCC
jgi:hypothetical protein